MSLLTKVTAALACLTVAADREQIAVSLDRKRLRRLSK